MTPAGSTGRRRPGLVPPFPILCFGYHPWSPYWKRNQSLMAALARRPAIAEVAFVNPAVWLSTPPRRLAADLRSVRRYSWRGVLPHRPVPGVRVSTPVHLPLAGRSGPVARLERALIDAALDRFGGRPFLLLVNGVRLESEDLVERAAERAHYHVFDWSDDFAQFHKDEAARDRVEALTTRCLRRADLVLAVNERLAARARAAGAEVEVVLNATGLLQGSGSPPQVEAPGARALAGRLRRPVVGYAGTINEHRVDLDLVAGLARRHPEWTFLFLGLVQLSFDRRFPSLPNIVFHPSVPHRQLGAYLELFDVAVIPHLDNQHTAGNNPLKLYDYLAAGKPVVSTRVAGTRGFEDIVRVAGSRAEFTAALERAVAAAARGEPRALVASRIERARAHTWEARAGEVEAILLRRLGAGETDAARERGAPVPPGAPSEARRGGR